jgi:rhamnogalacturonyl hydrolase YesR
MMSIVEVLLAVSAVMPESPLLPQLLAAFKSHADALVTVQSVPDGRWHQARIRHVSRLMFTIAHESSSVPLGLQVLDDPTTFLETSVTAMTLYALCTAVTEKWLDRATYDPVIQRAWLGLTSQVADDGTVNGICEGTGEDSNHWRF